MIDFVRCAKPADLERFLVQGKSICVRAKSIGTAVASSSYRQNKLGPPSYRQNQLVPPSQVLRTGKINWDRRRTGKINWDRRRKFFVQAK